MTIDVRLATCSAVRLGLAAVLLAMNPGLGSLLAQPGGGTPPATSGSPDGTPSARPNFIVILCDNLGYGDIEPFGSKLHRTPNLNRMAREGRLFTHFCVTSGVCTPSRASLLTGCYAQRIGMHFNPRDGIVLRPRSPYGLHPDEVTIAEVLRRQGYATGLIGKWHLGDQLPFLPTRQGFDYFFGIPYSDDMTQEVGRRLGERYDGKSWPPLPLMHNETVIEAPVDRNGLTRRYTDEAVKFITAHREEPFFLLLSQAMPGSTSRPFASPRFRGKSRNGPWGDAVEELDWSTGRVLDVLKRLKIDRKTLVIFTSDNGSPLARDPSDPSRGSNRPLHGRGYTTSEGAFRVPTIMWWPGAVPAGTACSELCSTLDLLPTLARLAGTKPPAGRKLDGHDIGPLVMGKPGATSPYRVFYYYDADQLQAVRSGPWKLFVPLESFRRHPHFKRGHSATPLLFNVVTDVGCTKDVAAEHPQVVARLMQLAQEARRELGDRGRRGAGQRAPGKIDHPTARVRQGARLRAGAATVDITPKPGVSLDGTISKPGPVRRIHDRLHARTLVLDDGSTRLAIVLCDVCMIGRDVVDRAKELARRQTSIRPDHMLVAATHSHAVVRAIHVGRGPLDDEYHRLLAERIAASIRRAEEHLAPARIAWGSFDKPEYVRCRRSLCREGSVGKNPFGESGERVASVAMPKRNVIGPAGPTDPQFFILSVQHADGKPLAVLGNYSVHYCGGYQRGAVSADYFGWYARALEATLDAGPDHPPFVGMMSNGTSGNTGAIASGGKRWRPFEWMKVAGRALADQTVRTMRSFTYRSHVDLDAAQRELELGVRRPGAERVAWARAVLAQGKPPYPHHWTPIYARETLALADYPPRTKLVLQALRIGELGVAAVPCEVFAETGLAIKKASPLRATFTIELANGYGGYLPPPKQHRLGGYETWPARSSFLEVDAEPKIRDTVLELLHRLTRPTASEGDPPR